MEENSRPHNVSKWVKVSVFAGIYLLQILNSVPWIWGNLTVYVTSYYVAMGEGSLAITTNWMISVNVLGFNIGVLIGNPIARVLGTRLTLFIAILLSNGGVLVSSIAMRYSIVLFCITLGVMTGLTSGVIQACQMNLIVPWTKRFRALAVSSIASSPIFGAVVVNFLMTLFINPTNESADGMKDNMKVFTEEDLIHRVPQSFILLGGISLFLNLVGLLLIREKPGDGTILENCIRRFRKSPLERTPLSSSQSYDVYSQDGESSTGDNPSQAEMREEDDGDGAETKQGLTPKQALRTHEFYVLWIYVAIETYAFYLFNTYYKSFGLLYIPDDHFLTAVVMVKCLATPFFTWASGLAMDKFGVKITAVFMTGLFCLVSSVFYLTPFNKWLYFIVCVFYGCSLFSLYCLTAACCLKIFGEAHFTTIMGMCLSSTYVLVPCLPVLSTWIIFTFGWFVLFTSVGFLALISVILLVWVLPEKTMF